MVVAVITVPSLVTGGMDQKKGLDNDAVMEQLQDSSMVEDESAQKEDSPAEEASKDGASEKSDDDALKELLNKK
jgi:hypothetical protein